MEKYFAKKEAIPTCVCLCGVCSHSARGVFACLPAAVIGKGSVLLRSLRGLTMSAAKPVVVFVLGPPGAGKGTQSQNIVQV
jgi:hypothetical protein